MKKQPHVFIGIPSRDSWKAKFGMSLLGAVSHSITSGIPVTVFNERYASVAENRNTLIKKALNMPEVTHLLFLDDDHTFPLNTIERLLSWEKHIIGIAYGRKRLEKDTGRPLTNIGDFFENGKIAELDPTQTLQPVSSVGGGTILIERSVLEVLKYPYFDEVLNKDGTRLGEDVYFCRKAQSYGYKIWVDTKLSLESGHIGDFEYRLD